MAQNGNFRTALLDFYDGLSAQSQLDIGWNIGEPSLCGQTGVTCGTPEVVTEFKIL